VRPLQVPDDELVERVTGRRLDPVTNTIYHLKFKPPPQSVEDRLIQRSDDTEDKLRNRLATHHKNVADVVGYYKDILVQVISLEFFLETCALPRLTVLSISS
jgi:adenylate kinase